jgi:colanic acid/amylovoran biosynthesis glycosyltransferase
MMRRVDYTTPFSPLAPSSPTLAYVAPDGGVLCEPQIHHELQAIEALGWNVLPITLTAGQRSPHTEFSFARQSLALDAAAPVARVLQSLLACLKLGPEATRSLGLLLRDMHRLGWSRPKSWALVARWLTAARLAQQLRNHNCTHVHAHGAHEPAQVAMYAAALCGITFSCMAYGRELFRHSLLLKEIATRSSRLMTASQYNKQWLEQQGVSAEHIAVVRCSPRPAESPSPSGDRAGTLPFATRRLRTGPYRIGVLCSLVERKGIDDVLQALAALIRQGCAPVKLLIAGQGPERLRLQVQADRLGIHACVEFVGEVAPRAAGAWLRTLDLFVAASKPDRFGDVDGIPLILVEAMAAGVPVVATRVTGIPELVLDNQTGLLAEPGQPPSLAEKIDLAMSDPDRLRAMAQAGRAHVRWEFGPEKNLRRLVSHFGVPPANKHEHEVLEKAA